MLVIDFFSFISQLIWKLSYPPEQMVYYYFLFYILKKIDLFFTSYCNYRFAT